MNNDVKKNDYKLPDLQLRQFQSLILRMFQCCQERMQYQSERFGLPDAELRCLMLFGEDKYCTSKGLSAKMNVVKSRITRIVEGLENKNMVQRTQDPKDSRVFLLSLTQDGKNKLNEIIEFNDYVHREVLRNIPADQRSLFLSTLETLKTSMETTRDLMV